jgi:aryl-alcohol dehydrogenase-like predicted oxidoreductase
MSSRLVLGGAVYGRLNQGEVNLILGTAIESGINRIDTAHGYEGSEERIGRFLRTTDQIKINSKVGLPDPRIFNPIGIKKSVEESLSRLGVETLETLFVHSLDPKYLTESNISAMISLKTEGKIQRLGYSGDGENLRGAVEIPVFDDFMATYNIIDQSNRESIEKVRDNSGIFYKLSMGQAVWSNLEWQRRVKNNKVLRSICRKPPVPNSWSDYHSRFKKLKSEISSEDFATTFLRFALFSGAADQNVILGTANPRHVISAVRIEQDYLNPESLETQRYEDLWLRKSSPEWCAHTG